MNSMMMVLLMSWVADAAAIAATDTSLPGDHFDMWLWVAVLAVSIAGFVGALYFLMVPAKRGKYERMEPAKKKS